jgi:hypothetical protein
LPVRNGDPSSNTSLSSSTSRKAFANFCAELLTTKQVSDRTFQATKEKFSERGVVDLIGVMGYYQLVSMLLNT